MKTLRTHATFSATFDGEPDPSPNDDIARPAGRDVLLVLSAALSEHGFHVSEPGVRDYDGWEVIATSALGRYWLLLQAVDRWLLICEDMTWFTKLHAGMTERHADVLRVTNEVLRGDPRFSEIRWFTQQEYGERQPGSSEP